MHLLEKDLNIDDIYSAEMFWPKLKNYPFKIFMPFIRWFFSVSWAQKKFKDCLSKENGDILKALINFPAYLNIKIAIDFPERIPEKGAIQIIANHDGELLDGLFLLTICGEKRNDYKFLAASELKDIVLLNYFCFFTNANSNKISESASSSQFNQLIRLLDNKHALCYFPIIYKFFKKNNRLRHLASPLPYYLAKKTSAPILPLHFKLQKSFRGRILQNLKQSCVKQGFPRLAYFFLVVEVLFTLCELRAMQGKTVYVSVRPPVSAPIKTLSKLEAMQFVNNLLLTK